MIWGELFQPGRFGPFVKIGIGAAHIHQKQYCEYQSLLNSNHNFWSFVYGSGGGIRFSPNRKMDILLDTKVIKGTTSNTYENASGRRFITHSPFGFVLYGITIRYWF